MTGAGWLAERFEEHRRHLWKVACRILGSSAEVDDALQEAWVRASRADAGAVDNLKAWLTTTVARVCLDMLRARRSRGRAAEASAADGSIEALRRPDNPEAELLLADSVGPALLVVLEMLEPAERVAFVLHDMFDVTFDEIAAIVGRSPDAARQLASRARRRVQGGSPLPEVDIEHHRRMVHAFLAASRDGNFEALLGLLDPDVVLRADDVAVETARATKWLEGLASETRGGSSVATLLNKRAKGVKPGMIDGQPGAVFTSGANPLGVWLFKITDGRIVEIEMLLDPSRLAQLEIEVESR
jgi:RNA polymerase sigma-70 factor (ECF subfamily)